MDKKHLFNFYMDDNVKQQVVDKLTKEQGKTEKGAMAALIRVLLQRYIAAPHDTQLMSDVAKEYIDSTRRNKRSRM